jgi:hypothetical protein
MSVDDTTLGIRHAHAFAPESALPRLQGAHDLLGWDVSKSRVLGFSACAVCGVIDRESVTECAVEGCTAHAVCRRPYH